MTTSTDTLLRALDGMAELAETPQARAFIAGARSAVAILSGVEVDITDGMAVFEAN
ncbi:hypothetical protein ACWDPV_18005 [Gordonia sp. NPDC003504]